MKKYESMLFKYISLVADCFYTRCTCHAVKESISYSTIKPTHNKCAHCNYVYNRMTTSLVPGDKIVYYRSLHESNETLFKLSGVSLFKP